MRKTFLTGLCVMLMLVLVGQGCKGPSRQEAALVRPVTIDYWTVFNDVDMLRQFAAEYRRTKPHVTINIRQLRADEFEELFVNALADDVGPDIISVHANEIDTYLSRLQPMPATVNVADLFLEQGLSNETVVEPIVQQMPSVATVENAFVSVVGDDVVRTSAGRRSVYGLPLAMDTVALYYNKALLDRAGVPEPPTNWDEFTEAVVASTKFDSTGALAQSGVALGTGNNIDNAMDIFTLLLLQNNVTIARGNDVSFADNIRRLGEDDPTYQALRFYTDFARSTKEVYSWNENMQNAFDAFVRGRSVFYFGYAFDRDRISARAPQMDVEVIPVPQLSVQNPVNVADYWVESVVAKSDAPDYAWDFIRFMATSDNISRYLDATGQPTPLRSLISIQQEDEDVAPFVSQVLTATNWYQGNDIRETREAFEELFDAFLLPLPEDLRGGEVDYAVQLLERAQQTVQQTY